MLDYSERVTKLLDHFKESGTLFNQAGTEKLLIAIDNICGAIHGIALAELAHDTSYWTRLDRITQKTLLFSYEELGRQGKNFADSRGITISYQGMAHPIEEVDCLINNSGVAQHIAHWYKKIGESFDPRAVYLLAIASLEALLQMEALIQVVEKQDRQQFFSGRINSGLTILEELLDEVRAN